MPNRARASNPLLLTDTEVTRWIAGVSDGAGFSQRPAQDPGQIAALTRRHTGQSQPRRHGLQLPSQRNGDPAHILTRLDERGSWKP